MPSPVVNKVRVTMKYLKIAAAVAVSFATFAQDRIATNQIVRTNLAGMRTNATPSRAPQGFDRTALEISPEHRTKLQEINRAYSTNALPVYQRLSTVRRELDSLINQDNAGEAALRAKAKEIGDLEAELAIARAKRYSQLRAFLTPEQARRFNASAPLNRPFQPSLHDGQAPPPVAPNK